MTESSSFTSLLALVDNHLSKVNMTNSTVELQDSNNGLGNGIRIPSLNGIRNGTTSDTHLFSPQTPKLQLSTLNLTENPINSILEKQVNNMLKAKELKRQEEEQRRKAEEERQLLELVNPDNYMIDLTEAIYTSSEPLPQRALEKTLSRNSSLNSLFNTNFSDYDEDTGEAKAPEILLPCKTDMSYILKQKIRHGKCSAFGKVLISRLRPVAAPYLKEKIVTDIVRFDFKTKSPCDLILEELRKPTRSIVYNMQNLSLNRGKNSSD